MMKKYIADNKELMLKTLEELCHIPAPSHHEEKRAEYCKSWLEKYGAKGVYIDDALNVIFPYNCETSNEITVFAAHTDTVFPDMEPMPYFDDGEKIFCPGASDDTASVTVLLLMAKYYIENQLKAEKGIMFVCNSCEEGLGNLKGTRQLFKDYENRIKQFITFDSVLNSVADRCVGSHRYNVTVKTEGGHSYGAFGNKNAINVLAEIVNSIYSIDVPKKEGTRTTYNVGTISGGTSVNTIAQEANMLCEYRSDDSECLKYMEERFRAIFKEKTDAGYDVTVELVGNRPSANIDPEQIEELKRLVVPEIEQTIGEQVNFKSSSTDCNIPLSLGVKALCIGTNVHAKVHTREEWVDKESLVPGLEIAIRVGTKLTEE